MPNLEYENLYGGQVVAGVDEAGRGPLCGPVVAAAVIIDKDRVIPGINDSKKLSPAKREKLYGLIKTTYIVGVGEASVEEINKYNILEATKMACIRAVENLPQIPEIVLVDGNIKFPAEKYISLIKGDSLSVSIAAASIIAKVHRDQIMKNLSELYPEYLWHKNSGYGTQEHIQALRAYGVTKHHREKFVRNIEIFPTCQSVNNPR